MNKIYSFFILLDGNYKELSYMEHKNVYNALFKSKIISEKRLMDELLLLSIKNSYVDLIRSWQHYSRIISLTKSLGLILNEFEYKSLTSFEHIINIVKSSIINSNFIPSIRRESTFRVEIIKKGNFDLNSIFDSKNRNEFKYEVADSFIEKYKLKVNLKEPNIRIQVLITPKLIILGILLFEVNRKAIKNRAPSHRSYFHPASMSPLLIRAMLNLSIKMNSHPLFGFQNKNNKLTFLDPFMGGAGMLIEAIEQGFSTIGLELGYWECRGARMNLISFQQINNLVTWNIIKCNSSLIPLKSNTIDIIVSDPPYGISTMVGGSSISVLISDVLKECFRILKNGSRIIISIPSTLEVNFNKFIKISSVSDKVHQSLTRIIWILEKPIS